MSNNKHIVRHVFEIFQKQSQKCERFSYGTFGGYFWDLWDPYVAETPQQLYLVESAFVSYSETVDMGA